MGMAAIVEVQCRYCKESEDVPRARLEEVMEEGCTNCGGALRRNWRSGPSGIHFKGNPDDWGGRLVR